MEKESPKFRRTVGQFPHLGIYWYIRTCAYLGGFKSVPDSFAIPLDGFPTPLFKRNKISNTAELSSLLEFEWSPQGCWANVTGLALFWNKRGINFRGGRSSIHWDGLLFKPWGKRHFKQELMICFPWRWGHGWGKRSREKKCSPSLSFYL